MLISMAVITQSCEKQAEPTYMEDYLKAEDFTADWTDDFANLDRWEMLPNDGEENLYPFYYQVIDVPDAKVYPEDYGIRFDAYSNGWNQRFVRDGFDVDGDFEIEFKVKIIEGTGSEDWQKGGFFIGDIGDNPPELWLTLENPVDVNHGNVNRYIPGAEEEWLKMDEGQLSVFDWQVLKVIKSGNNLKIYRNDQQILDYTNDIVNNIKGKVGICADGLSCDYEYLSVNGVKDDFTNMDNWSNLEEVTTTPPSVWTPGEDGLTVVAQEGWNHRAMWETLPENYIVEFKIKMGEPISTFPKAGIVIGELGDSTPKMILGLDNYAGESSIVKYIQSRPGDEWQNFKIPELNVKEWQLIRLKKTEDNIFVYINGYLAYYEKGEYIANMQGRLGLIVEGCEAYYEFLSYKAN